MLGGVLLIAAAAALMLRRTPASVANIYLDGALVRSVDLLTVTEPYAFTIESEDRYNVIAVDSGRISVSDANCPDSYCIRQGWISSGAVPIVCLPHKLVITFEARGARDMDAIVG